MKAYPFTITNPATGKAYAGQADALTTLIIKDSGTPVATLYRPREVTPGYYSITLTDDECAYSDYLLLIIRHPELEDKVMCDTGLSEANDLAKAVFRYLSEYGVKSYPELGKYCTREDVELRWGKINVTMMADVDNDNNPDKIARIIDRCLNQVYIRMNSDFSMSIYRIPFDISQCLIVRRYATDLAGIELYKIRQLAMQNEVELFKRAEEDYKQWLTQVYNGQDIPGAVKDFVQY